MKRILLSLAICGLRLHAADAEPPPSQPNIRVEVLMVSMPLAKGLALLPNLRDAGSIEGAYSTIQKMIAAGEATLFGMPEVVTKPGQRAVTEDIDEMRYASEFDKPPTETKPVDAPPTGLAASPAPRGGAPVPSAFETRNVGTTLEVETNLAADGKTIDLNIVPQHVRFIQFTTVAAGRDALGHDWKIEQPHFYTAKTTTSLSVRSGQRILLAEFRGPAGGGQIELFLGKAEVLPLTAPEHP